MVRRVVCLFVYLLIYVGKGCPKNQMDVLFEEFIVYVFLPKRYATEGTGQ